MLIPLSVALNLTRSMRSLRLLFALLLVAIACSDTTGLPDATLNNIEREETLYALVGTPVATPSGYAIEGPRRVRTDISDDFDFAYNIEADGRHVLIPLAGLGIDTGVTVKPGLQEQAASFEAITVAPSNGYITNQPVLITQGGRYAVRGRITCLSLGVPKYAKLEILSFDATARSVTFRVLINDSCGYKGLEPGVPTR